MPAFSRRSVRRKLSPHLAIGRAALAGVSATTKPTGLPFLLLETKKKGKNSSPCERNGPWRTLQKKGCEPDERRGASPFFSVVVGVGFVALLVVPVSSAPNRDPRTCGRSIRRVETLSRGIAKCMVVFVETAYP